MAGQTVIVSLDNGIYSTLSTACFLACHKLATIVKHGLITHLALLHGFFCCINSVIWCASAVWKKKVSKGFLLAELFVSKD